MKSSKKSDYFEILAGGRTNHLVMNLSGVFHKEGQMRRGLFIQNALAMMHHADLGKKELPAVASIIHTPSPHLGNMTPWDSADHSNLQFGFAQIILRRGISELAGKDVDLTEDEKKSMHEHLKGISQYMYSVRQALEP